MGLAMSIKRPCTASTADIPDTEGCPVEFHGFHVETFREFRLDDVILSARVEDVPLVGMATTTLPSTILYRIVVFPAESSPT